MALPRGYEIADEFSRSGVITSVPAGAGVGIIAPTILATRNPPSGALLYIVELSARVVDAGSDQIFISLQRNGMFPFQAFFKIPGVQFDYTTKLTLDVSFTPALIEIVAHNISGTAEPGAGPAASIRCQAYWTGYLLRLIRKTVFV